MSTLAGHFDDSRDHGCLSDTWPGRDLEAVFPGVEADSWERTVPHPPYDGGSRLSQTWTCCAETALGGGEYGRAHLGVVYEREGAGAYRGHRLDNPDADLTDGD